MMKAPKEFVEDREDNKPTLTEWLEKYKTDRKDIFKCTEYHISVDNILEKIKSGEFSGL